MSQELRAAATAAASAKTAFANAVAAGAAGEPWSKKSVLLTFSSNFQVVVNHRLKTLRQELVGVVCLRRARVLWLLLELERFLFFFLSFLSFFILLLLVMAFGNVVSVAGAVAAAAVRRASVVVGALEWIAGAAEAAGFRCGPLQKRCVLRRCG